MNIKRYVLSSVLLFGFIYLYEMCVHGYLLRSIYMQTPNIWRSYETMQLYIPFNLALQGIIAAWLAFVFAQLFKQGGLLSGLKFGLFFGVLAGLQSAGAYFYLPISGELATYWFLAMMMETVLGGLLLGLVYRA